MANSIDCSEQWYSVDDIDRIDSPALLLYRDRIAYNIQLALQLVSDVERLRPHVKTNKIAEVCQMMLAAGITKFKCATIAEAEMLASIKAPDILLAYQPVGPKTDRLANLIKAFPAQHFACLTDSVTGAGHINEIAAKHGIVIPVYIDLNVGMNRTGILPQESLPLVAHILTLKNLKLEGLHAYDGHIRDKDFTTRQQHSDAGFKEILTLKNQIEETYSTDIKLVAGGTPTFPTHANRQGVECSPGTFVFSDWGYKQGLPDEAFEYAALVITRIISIPNEHTVCVDLGHKSVAAEHPLPRVHFLNAPDAVPVSQSEEHLVLQVSNSKSYQLGEVLYGVPVHICPTVALYDKAYVVENKKCTTEWNVVARKRSIRF